MTPWGFGVAPPCRTSCISSPFQSAGSWKGHQIPQRRHCKKAARDVEVADSCVMGKDTTLEDIQTMTWLLLASCMKTTLITASKSLSLKFLYFFSSVRSWPAILLQYVHDFGQMFTDSFPYFVTLSKQSIFHQTASASMALGEHSQNNNPKSFVGILCHHGQSMDPGVCHWNNHRLLKCLIITH